MSFINVEGACIDNSSHIKQETIYVSHTANQDTHVSAEFTLLCPIKETGCGLKELLHP